MKFKILLLISLLLLLSGCSVNSAKQIVLGEYHLQQKEYKEGHKYFKQELKKDQNNHVTHYYYARFLLADNKPKKALVHLKKAVKLDLGNSNYYTWLGVAYGSLQNLIKEEEAYKNALSLDPENIHALTYLGHNYFDQKKYTLSLNTYEKVLKRNPENQIALYNRALCIQKLNETATKPIKAWKKYLDYYPSGYFAIKAVEHLNSLGNFDYRNYIIGLRKITLKNIIFKPNSYELTYEAKQSLNVIGRVLTKYKTISVHVVVYQLDNKRLAQQKAKSIKKYLTDRYKGIEPSRLKLSWLKEPKNVIINKKRYKLDEVIDFISIVSK